MNDQIRIAWRINGTTGTGSWYPADQRSMLTEIVEECNDRCGPGTHWIEARSDERQLIHRD